MVLAELQGKLSSSVAEKEDILTSNVFSFFKYSDRKYLFNYLKLLGIPILLKDAADAEFEFWPNYSDGTQPDLVIICGDYYIILEAKLYSDFSERIIDEELQVVEKQLQREAKRGKEVAILLGKTPIIIAITSEPYKCEEKYAFASELEMKFIWTNWQFIAKYLFCTIEQEEDNNLFLNDLYKLLLRKNLRSFRSFKQIIIREVIPENNQIFYNRATSEFKGEYSGFLSELKDLQPIGQFLPRYRRLFYQFEITKLINFNQSFFYHGNNSK
jgi:hypothetical protein